MVRIPQNGPPTHPGEMLLEECLKPLRMMQSDLAEKLVVSYPRVNELIHGKRGVTPDTALRLERFFGRRRNSGLICKWHGTFISFTSGYPLAAQKLPTAIRQDQIVEAAFQMLSENASKRLNIKDIAVRMGLAPSALYRHFRNRDAVLSAVLELIRNKLYKNIEAVRQGGDDPVGRLQELLSRHMRLVRERR